MDEVYDPAIKYYVINMLRQVKFRVSISLTGETYLHPVTERDACKCTLFPFNVESLQTLRKLETIEGVSSYIIIKKLEILKPELVTVTANRQL